jgi:hypothetical protein
MTVLPLQATGGYMDHLMNGEVFKALSGPFIDAMGVPLSALMFFGGIGVAYYAVSGRAVMPVIMTILIGGVTLQFAPPSAQRFAIIVLVLGITSVAYLAWKRASGSPGGV